MHMIEAVIKPRRLEAVMAALATMGIRGVTAVECKGFGNQRGHTEQYRGGRVDYDLVAKVLLKLCVPADLVQTAVTTIQETGRTGTPGDGRIFVYPIAQAVRVRTGETGDAAL